MLKELETKTKIIIFAIILTTLAVVIGFTYAYFSSSTVSGNVDNTINVITSNHGNITVEYYNSDPYITMNNIDF